MSVMLCKMCVRKIALYVMYFLFIYVSEADRERWTDTLQQLYTITNLTEGRELYGNKFFNAESFLYFHLNGAGRTDCDHW